MILQFFLALLPILVILILMVGFRWGASRSGGAGYLLTLLIALAAYGATPKLLAYSHMKALLLSLDVLLIIWAAFLLFKVAEEAGAIRTIGSLLPKLTSDRTLQSLIIGWVFASFLQGIGEFGVPVAVIAPILIGLGFEPLLAVIIPSIGHGWAVSFGSLGSSINALMATTGLSSQEIVPEAAIFLGIAAILSGWMVAYASGGLSKLLKYFLLIFFVGLAMATGQFLAAIADLWNIAAFVGALSGLAVILPVTLRDLKKQPDKEKPEWSKLWMALSNYIILVALILFIQFVPGVKPFLSQIRIKLAFPEIATSAGYITPAGFGRQIPIFTHAGIILLYASLTGFLIYKKRGAYSAGAGKRILSETVKKMTGSSISILSMVSLAVIMEHSGMTRQLAIGLSSGIQSIYPFVAPWIGAIGAFMTGSNTNSNVVFGLLQLETARILILPISIILAGQTAGAALASVIAPTKMVVGASTAGLSGREGEVMRALIGYTLILVSMISLLTFIGVLIFGVTP